VRSRLAVLTYCRLEQRHRPVHVHMRCTIVRRAAAKVQSSRAAKAYEDTLIRERCVQERLPARPLPVSPPLHTPRYRPWPGSLGVVGRMRIGSSVSILTFMFTNSLHL